MGYHLEITLGFDSPDERDEAAELMCRCPYVVKTTPSVTGGSADLTLVFVLSDEKLGWALTLAAEPELIGAGRGRVESLKAASEAGPAGGGTTAARQPSEKADSPPCGSDCAGCPYYLDQCGGCPASSFYTPGYRFEPHPRYKELVQRVRKG